jgi:hypothetical protein
MDSLEVGELDAEWFCHVVKHKSRMLDYKT